VETGSLQLHSPPRSPAQFRLWFDATNESEEKAAARRLNKVALDHVVYAPLGMFLRYYAWRKNVIGIGQAPLPLFWGVSKTA
jgi:peptide/nickel transport system substrate-binding protein